MNSLCKNIYFFTKKVYIFQIVFKGLFRIFGTLRKLVAFLRKTLLYSIGPKEPAFDKDIRAIGRRRAPKVKKYILIPQFFNVIHSGIFFIYAE